MQKVRQLDVFDGEKAVGFVYDTDPISFKYSSSWINGGGYKISAIESGRVYSPPLWGAPLQAKRSEPYASCPLDTPPLWGGVVHLKDGHNSSEAVRAFFENLLPEGVLRETLALEKKASSVFSLLLEIAGDNTGNLVILPEGEKPQPNRYEPTTWVDIAGKFSGNNKNIDSEHGGNRISISGAQRKTAIGIDESGYPLWPLGTTPSMYIVKPDIKVIDKVWSSAANEALIMRTAKHCSLDVAEVFYEPISKSCIVKRFDRNISDGKIDRLIQYDFCQISSIGSDRKYESEGGPGIKSCVDLIKKHSVQPGVDLKRFYQWIFFNLMTGNNDSHAKNLSFFQAPGKGLSLTPHYDLMCTRLYPGLSKSFAYQIGGKSLPGEIGFEQISLMAKDLGLKPSYLMKIAFDVHSNLLPAMEKASFELEKSFGPSEKLLSERLIQKVRSIAKSFAQRMTDGESDLPDEQERE